MTKHLRNTHNTNEATSDYIQKNKLQTKIEVETWGANRVGTLLNTLIKYNVSKHYRRTMSNITNNIVHKYERLSIT